jgi:hypothetical protein
MVTFCTSCIEEKAPKEIRKGRERERERGGEGDEKSPIKSPEQCSATPGGMQTSYRVCNIEKKNYYFVISTE